MTSSIQPRIQRIQAAISQANISGQEPGSPNAAGQSRVCSFEIEGRSQVGYLGVNSIAEVTPPWFPKDAFQVKGSSEKPVSPIITLKSAQPQTSQPKSEVTEADTANNFPQQSSVTASPDGPPLIQSSVSVDVFQAVAGRDNEFVQEELPIELNLSQPPQQDSKDVSVATETSPVTAEVLADLFEQADPLAQKSAAEPSPTTECPKLCTDESEPKQPHKSLLAPVSQAEQAAAQALAQSLSQSLEKSLPQSLDASQAQQASNIKPIETVTPPALPRSKSPEISSHNNSTNPMLPLELLQNIGQEVIVWQEALKEVHQKIQTLYQEGPILNGWLEKHSDAGVYQLCGLDPTGQSWRRPCHPDQLQPAGLAIGRYKKLRLLLGEKQRLDQRIKRLSETLTMLRLRLRAY